VKIGQLVQTLKEEPTKHSHEEHGDLVRELYFFKEEKWAKNHCCLWQIAVGSKTPHSIPQKTSFVFIFEHEHSVQYTQSWLELIIKLIMRFLALSVAAVIV
jgi:hypothetical protein